MMESGHPAPWDILLCCLSNHSRNKGLLFSTVSAKS
jgi:hypothetical protein